MDRRNLKTRKLIKDNLIELLKLKSLSHITVTELTEKCNISRKTFYLHYQSIEYAVEDIENDILSIIEALFLTLYDDTKTPNFDNVPMFFKHYLENSITLIDFLANYKSSQEIKSKITEKIIFLIKENSYEPPNSPVDIDLSLYYTVGGIYDALIYWYKTQSVTTEKFADCCTRLVHGTFSAFFSE